MWLALSSQQKIYSIYLKDCLIIKENNHSKLYTNCTQTVHKLYTKCTQTVHKMYTNCTQNIHKMYTNCTQTVHKLYTNSYNKLAERPPSPAKKIQYTFSRNKTPATHIDIQAQYLLYNIEIFTGDKSWNFHRIVIKKSHSMADIFKFLLTWC